VLDNGSLYLSKRHVLKFDRPICASVAITRLHKASRTKSRSLFIFNSFLNT